MSLQNENQIPIDIHTNKLLEWLISRRHCNRDWQDSIISIRKKINNAIQDMPEVEEIKDLLAGSYINYFHCVRIIEILRETEKTSKNIFGQYSSQRMKDWQEIVKLQESNNAYLAEAAQMLIRNVVYEVPSLKKQIAKSQQAQEELAKKENEFAKLAQEMKDKYTSMCKDFGIQGKNLHQELLGLLSELPAVFSEVIVDLQKIREAREFYVAFLLFLLPNSDLSGECLPLLSHLLTKGNTTVYEWRFGEPPEVVEETQLQLPIEIDNNSDQIDFGDDNAIDFGDENSSSTNGDFVHIDKIDFGDELMELGSPAVSEINYEFPNEASAETAPEDKVARNGNALSLLDNSETRNQLLNELKELEGFLNQRLSEMTNDHDILASNKFSSAPPLVQLQTTQSIQKMLKDVKEILTRLTTVKLQHLYLLKGSPKYVDRLVEGLNQKLEKAEKMLSSKEVMVDKQKQALEEQRSLQPRLELIVEKTKILQKQIEKDISKRYKDRPVNIMGGINTI